VPKALAAKQAITDLGNMAAPPNRRLYWKMGRASPLSTGRDASSSGTQTASARVHVYLEEEPTGTPRAAKLLPGDEARRIGANIANRRRCYGGPQLLERSWGVICTRIVRRPSMLRAPAVAEYTNERY
jgi:hypothetical protein